MDKFPKPLKNDKINCHKPFFDWEYYLQHNSDLTEHGIDDHDQAYQHWLKYGIKEKRKYRLLDYHTRNHLIDQNIIIYKQWRQKHSLRRAGFKSKPAKPSFIKLSPNQQIALLIHIFDPMMLRSFINYLNRLFRTYDYRYFRVFINLVLFPPKRNQDYLEQIVGQNLPRINCETLREQIIFLYSENRGGDIGGLLLLIKQAYQSNSHFSHYLFVHSKTDKQWRKQLCRALFNIKFEQLNADSMKQIGLWGARQWIREFQPYEWERYVMHLNKLCAIYDIDYETIDKRWSFIAGTMFLARADIIHHIATHSLSEVWYMMNQPHSLDLNWIQIMDSMGKDRKETTNDYQYRLTYGQSLFSDFMIEHTFERMIGLITHYLGFKIAGC